MEKAPENGKESPHSAHANGMNECFKKYRGSDKHKISQMKHRLEKLRSDCESFVCLLAET